MRLDELTEGTHIRAGGRTWAITLIQPESNGELKLYLAAVDADGTFPSLDWADLHGKPDTDVETVPTTVTLTCPICVTAQIEDTDHVEEVTAPTLDQARKLLVDHILDTYDLHHDDVNIVEYLVKHQA